MSIDKIYEYIDIHKETAISKLSEMVSIKSVSSDLKIREEVVKMGDWLYNELKSLKADVQKIPIGKQQNTQIDLPPVIIGKIQSDKSKKTILIYGHYDVQPAHKSDGWDTDPFILTKTQDGRLIGRGSTDDKAPILGWLMAVKAHIDCKIELPVNLIFCFEGMEESSSEGLDQVIKKEAKNIFKDVDCVCISDNYWLGKKKPCLTYGLRGILYFHITIEGPKADLHSGVFGGIVYEPMTDLIKILSKLVQNDGNILIPHIMDDVLPLNEEEKELYQNIEFKLNDVLLASGENTNIHENEMDILLKRWRYPSLSIHGIEGDFSDGGDKTVIPSKVIGKFSIRIVPNMDPAKIQSLVTDYLNEEFKKLKSKNKFKVVCTGAGKPWISNFNHWNYTSGSNAIEKVFGIKPDFIREGGSIPVTLTFQEELNKNVLLLPMGASDDVK